MKELFMIDDSSEGGLYTTGESDEKDNVRVTASNIAVDDIPVGQHNDLDMYAELCEKKFGFVPDGFYRGEGYDSLNENYKGSKRYRSVIIFIKF